jgi:hypothetical protein
LSTNYVNVHDDAEKAEAFNSFFSSQSNIDDTDKSVPADDTPPPRCLDRIVLRQHFPIMFLSSFLWTGVTFASFHLFGKCLVIRLMLKIAHNGLEIIS